MINTAIIGGGASGLIAALSASKEGIEGITVFERSDRVGRKILATGNGRCNYSNLNSNEAHYHGTDKSFVTPALNEFTVNDTVNFFNNMGVFPREEEKGKLYPYSLQASGVLDCLRNAVEKSGIEVLTGKEVTDIQKGKGNYTLFCKDKSKYKAKTVIVAGGGCASPVYGTDGSAFELLKALGHTLIEPHPALVQLKTESAPIRGLKGIKINAKASLTDGTRVIAASSGEVLFTDYGLSGPPIFDLSVHAAGKKELYVLLDMMDVYSPKDVFDILEGRKRALSELTMENFFVGLLNKRLGNLIARASGIEKLSYAVSKLDTRQLWAIAGNIKEYKIKITGNNGFKNAQACLGGIATSEFDAKTLQSRIFDGLFACGEVLDICGDCGGYNLQWAWSSGYVAGKNAARLCI